MHYSYEIVKTYTNMILSYIFNYQNNLRIYYFDNNKIQIIETKNTFLDDEIIVIQEIYIANIEKIDYENKIITDYANKKITDYANIEKEDYANIEKTDYKNKIISDYKNKIISDYVNVEKTDYENKIISDYVNVEKTDYADEIIVTQKIDIPHIEITDSDEDYCYFIYFD
jgi:hypothetical protein